jgi:cbb3-type cytochrome oxidase maturation protein
MYAKVVLTGKFNNMSAIYLLIVISILVASAFLMAFIWSVKTNQYEDPKGPAIRMLQDNDTFLAKK